LPTASPTKSPLEQPLKKATNVNLPQIEIQLNSLTIENNSVVAKLSLVSLADSVMVNFDKILGNKGFADAYLLEEKTGKKYKVLSASQALNHFLAKKQDRALYFICFYAPPAGTIVTLGIPNLATFKNLNL
jgi:hypothetical protein